MMFAFDTILHNVTLLYQYQLNTSFVTSRYLATGDAITTIAYNSWTGVSTARNLFWMFVWQFGMS